LMSDTVNPAGDTIFVYIRCNWRPETENGLESIWVRFTVLQCKGDIRFTSRCIAR